MRYGAVPIVRNTGGLKDSVWPIEEFADAKKHGYGYLFTEEDPTALTKVVEKSLLHFADKRSFNKVIRHNMRVDFSWKERANSYLDIYFDLLDKERPASKNTHLKERENQ